MSSKFNDVLELIDSFSIEEREQIIEIEKNRLQADKREKLIERVKEGKKDIKEGRFIEGEVQDIMKAIDDEVKDIK
ncbi:MAG TPA: hypothetical protein PKE39_15925 [Ignavibacteria bacterium]|nr:hypothetical protein [Ignavibacteria bacterium]HMR00512.1 hypothetical protein [Ignavibacteria bacterium]